MQDRPPLLPRLLLAILDRRSAQLDPHFNTSTTTQPLNVPIIAIVLAEDPWATSSCNWSEGSARQFY